MGIESSAATKNRHPTTRGIDVNNTHVMIKAIAIRRGNTIIRQVYSMQWMIEYPTFQSSHPNKPLPEKKSTPKEPHLTSGRKQTETIHFKHLSFSKGLTRRPKRGLFLQKTMSWHSFCYDTGRTTKKAETSSQNLVVLVWMNSELPVVGINSVAG